MSDSHPRAGFWALTVGSIGVVYGDIGTSPLYAFREAALAASSHTQGAPTQEAVFGVLSLIVWALILIVTVKYVLVLLRADNKGEGGTLSLMALAQQASGQRGFIVALGILAAALFYGDSLITPAISVLSAVEGLKLVTPAFDPYIVALTVGVLIVLFAVQSHGTARVAALFGPIMVVWFIVIALIGLLAIAKNPSVLLALNPAHAANFLASHGAIGLYTLGAVFLAVTGAEALYADLGHFGRIPIQSAWLFFVLPSLVINYFGQGALMLANSKTIENPFFLLFPDWALLPIVMLATAATVIASQAVITGAYSLSRQAIQLGLLPRFQIRHTSEALAGQIYMPRVNALLLAGVLLLVLLFRSSSGLAAAYGIAVSGTMVVTAIMALIVIRKVWRWPLWASAALIAAFLLVDGVFLGANLLKIHEGGWVSLFVSALVVVLMYVWRRGTRILVQKTRRIEVPIATLLTNLEKRPPHVVPGTAVFLTSDPAFAPTALLHNLKHNKVLHENNVILTIVTAGAPRVSGAERVLMTEVSPRFRQVILRFGFMESPNVPRALAIARKLGWQFDIMATSFYLSRRALRPAARHGVASWLDRAYIGLAKSAADATDFFQIPTGRVVEVGTQVTV